jgi:hypothetical protein
VLSGLTNLATLSLYANSIRDIHALVDNSGLGTEDSVYIHSNFLDLTPGSPVMLDIEALEDRGVDVSY